MLKAKYALPSSRAKLSITESYKVDNAHDFTWSALKTTSRSFSVVIMLLIPELREAVCSFYLILRGLDSVEDDMDYPVEKRAELLRSFHQKIQDKTWKISGVGDKPMYRELLAGFDKVLEHFHGLKKEYRDVITDITEKMGNGMADFGQKYDTSLIGVGTTEEYEQYCHYVAGLVGLGLDRLFFESGLENFDVEASKPTANSMGLFLQKVNITRDFLEDINDKRSWWPKDIWGLYAPDLHFFSQNPHSIRSRLALNHMITNALKHVPDVMTYCGKLQDQSVFNFCAVPQVMAVATLALLYNNNDALTRTLKIRKGLTADVAMNCKHLSLVKGFFYRALADIKSKLIHPRDDPFYSVATAEEMKLAISLFEDTEQVLHAGLDACKGYEVIGSGWGTILAITAGIGAVTVGVCMALQPHQ
jgi:farnesyl-diphosphate farnesyltransferase